MTPEEIITCPYNKAHSIIANRMQFHLTRCRAQYPYAEKTTCPFNSTHIVNKIELDFHQIICEDRIVLDTFSFKLGVSNKPPVKSKEEEEIKFEESWDNELMDHSVLESVKEDSLRKPALTVLIGAPKSERKAHRFNERLRIQEVLYHQEMGINQKQKESSAKKKGNVNKMINNASKMNGSSSGITPVCNIPHTHVEEQNNQHQFADGAYNLQNKNMGSDNFVTVVRKGKSKNKLKTDVNALEMKLTALQLPTSSSQCKKKELPEPAKTSLKNDHHKLDTDVAPKCSLAKESRGMFSSPWKLPVANLKTSSSQIGNIDDFPVLPTAGHGRGKSL